MQTRFYYENSMTKQFTSTIEKITQDEQNNTYIVLHNTAFYPTGGGQPHDTGTINGIQIINVEEIDGEIRHYVAEGGSVEGLSGEVEGVLNWERRFDHMQQHAGQHILTAAFVELFDLPTVSFHLGSDTVTIDLQTSAVTEDQLAAAEKRANEIILENRDILTKWVTMEEANTYPLRKALKVEGDIRLVIIPDYDYNGCGGTHPTSTGQVQAIKILATEKMKQNIRVHFVCGKRVLQTLHLQNNVLTNVAKQLSVPKEDAAIALQKVMATAKATEKALADAQDELLTFEANALLADAEQNNKETIIQLFPERSMQQLQKLAKLLTAKENVKVALVGEFEEKYQLVVARGNAQATSMKNVMQTILPLIDGKGGGSDQLAQGGGSKLISAEAIIHALTDALSN
jgi:alanyl-tRNA synthetase